jgi:phenylacetate-coenzyme A ligase PaaK-like adenylate-forming protein
MTEEGGRGANEETGSRRDGKIRALLRISIIGKIGGTAHVGRRSQKTGIISYESIRGLDDLTHLPFTTSEEIRPSQMRAHSSQPRVTASQEENVLLQVDGTGSEYALTVADHPTRKGLQRLYIAIEGDPDAGIAETVAHRIRVEYNHSPIETIVAPGTIPRWMGKAKRIYTQEDYQALVEGPA